MQEEPDKPTGKKRGSGWALTIILIVIIIVVAVILETR